MAALNAIFTPTEIFNLLVSVVERLFVSQTETAVGAITVTMIPAGP